MLIERRRGLGRSVLCAAAPRITWKRRYEAFFHEVHSLIENPRHPGPQQGLDIRSKTWCPGRFGVKAGFELRSRYLMSCFLHVLLKRIEDLRALDVLVPQLRPRDSAFCQEVLNITEAQAEPAVQPDGVTDDLGRESMPTIADVPVSMS